MASSPPRRSNGSVPKRSPMTPKALPVRSIGGFTLLGDRPLAAETVAVCDAIVVVGSENWFGQAAPDIAPLLKQAAAAGSVVAGICAGTLPLARAGLFAGRTHTSNGRRWIRERLGYYPGDSRYRDVPHAVVDGPIVSAPGTAAGTFALGVLSALYPDSTEMLAELRATFASEYATAEPHLVQAGLGDRAGRAPASLARHRGGEDRRCVGRTGFFRSSSISAAAGW